MLYRGISVLLLLCGYCIKDSFQWDLVEGDVTYYLFTRENNENDSYIFLNSSNLDDLDVNRSVVFLLHGWSQSWTTEWFVPLREALLDHEDVSVIEVDYSPIASLMYPIAVPLSENVGYVVGDFIVEINKNVGIELDDFYIIGHSMGGQVAGFAGKRVLDQLGSPIGKITALDPAGPLYYDGFRLESTDATIVEAVHTDGNGFGYYGESGTVDIYVNGGTGIQPGCPDLITDFEALILGLDTSLFFCSHQRSYEYYTEAVQYGGFTSTRCSSYTDYLARDCKSNEAIEMAGNITLSNNGTYYLQTNNQSLYSLG